MRFSSFLEHAPAGFALCQSPGNITSTNSVFDELLGLSSSPIPVILADLIQPQDGCDTARLLSELFRGTRESFQIECSVLGDISKSRRWTVWAIRGGDARPEFAVVMLEDLTGAAAAQQRLHQAGRLETSWPVGWRSCSRLQQCVDRSFVVLGSAAVGRRFRPIAPGSMPKKSAQPDCKLPAWFGNCLRLSDSINPLPDRCP